MNKNTILFIALTFFITFFSFGQNYRYEAGSDMFFGLNLGATHHTSDVKNVNNGGISLLLGKSFNHDYGKVFTYDVRLRYLYGIWSGQDDEALTGTDLDNTPVLNELYGDQGLAFQNFESTQHRGALELALHLNWLKERTKIDPYVFGGIGVTGTQTLGDLTDGAGMPYDYASNPSAGITDGQFNDPLALNANGDLYSTSNFDVNVLPSLGFGLGYYFNDRFSLGLEHKTTFFNSDYFDGTVVNQAGNINGKNDRYQFSSLYIRWYFKGGSSGGSTKPTPPTTTTDVNTYTGTGGSQKPVVTFTNPSSSPHKTDAEKLPIRAEIKNITSSKNVSFYQDGEPNHDFTYNAITNKFQCFVNLKPGQNVFKVRGTNATGSDEAIMIIETEESEPQPVLPSVEISKPSSSPYTTSNQQEELLATIKHVESQEYVAIEVNGQALAKDFLFSPTGKNNFKHKISLSEGQNVVKIRANNQYGEASDQTVVIYSPIVVKKPEPPIVEYTDPVKESIQVTDEQYTIRGKVYNVDGKENVRFIQNGAENKNFLYSKLNKQFRSEITLQPGANVFQLIGINEAGSDQKTITISYDEPTSTPPVVTIHNPNVNPFVTLVESHPLIARVLNVTQKNQVEVTLNGKPITQFSFNNLSGAVNAFLTLEEGSNIVKVTGKNEDGVESKQTKIIRKVEEKQQPPVVDFINPTTNPFTTEKENEGVLALVQNVDKKAQIQVNANGLKIDNFTFDKENNTISFTSDLVLGANLITVTATNEVGADSKSTTVIYKKSLLPPVITYVDPVQDPKTVYTSSYNVKAKVKHVSNSNNIRLKINGNESNNFSYNTNSEIIEFTTGFAVGANSIEITATNEAGVDVETTTFIYKKEDHMHPPIVTISSPPQYTYTVTSPSASITATVLNVKHSSDITVLVNGQELTNFYFNNTTKVLSFNMSLNEGENDLLISAETDVGSDSDERKIIYDKETPVQPPFVSYIKPASSGKNVSVPTYEMIATVDHVESKAGVSIKFNGSSVDPNSYSYNTASKEVKFTTNLSEGNNYFNVKGTNSAGTHESSTNVVYTAPEPDCDAPEIAFVSPSSNNTVVDAPEFYIKALIHEVVDEKNITLRLNGTVIGNFDFNTITHELKRKISLDEGNNVIEIIAETECGREDVTMLVKHKPVEDICDEPAVEIISPQAYGYSTLEDHLSVKATVVNVDQTNQIKLKVNGATKNFDFDPASHIVSGNIPLEEGTNIIVVEVTNECGDYARGWEITREKCETPRINLTSQPNTGEVAVANASISGTIADASEKQITVRLNGNKKSFTFNETTQAFNTSLTLKEGANNVIITASSQCGEAEQTFNFNYEPPLTTAPPVVDITAPASSPYETDKGSYFVKASITNVSSAEQISVVVNNSARAFNFEAGVVSFNQNLKEGANTVVITATNETGTAEDNTKIVYEVPEAVVPPIVAFSNPSVEYLEVEKGSYTFTGTIDNLSSTSQMEMVVNDEENTQYNATMNANGVVQFDLTVNVSASHPYYTARAIGTNEAGSDNATVVIELPIEEDEETTQNCLPEVSAIFENDHKSVVTSSDKDLSNVVLLYYDDEHQKFDGLSGKTGTFAGTEEHEGKCVLGVWIKSGCNNSEDGPGYGEWIPNTAYDGSCSEAPCDPPAIQLLSSNDVTKESYELALSVTNVKTNEVSITHNGKEVNCSFDNTSKVFTCSVNLEEGENIFTITADGCEVETKVHKVNYTIPCDPITYTFVYPSSTTAEVNDPIVSVNFKTENVTKSGITAKLNGTSVNAQLSGKSLIFEELTLHEGENKLEVTLKNECSEEDVTFTLNYVPRPCGPRINPGNAEWQFCLVTPSGTYNRSDLTNKSFSYSGPASSIYFLPIAGGGDVILNGDDYEVKNGQYYLFEGNLFVEISSNHPGSMGHWQVCLTADNTPAFGKGNNRPQSPCAEETTNLGGQGQSGQGGGQNDDNKGNKGGNGASGKSGGGESGSQQQSQQQSSQQSSSQRTETQQSRRQRLPVTEQSSSSTKKESSKPSSSEKESSAPSSTQATRSRRERVTIENQERTPTPTRTRQRTVAEPSSSGEDGSTRNENLESPSRENKQKNPRKRQMNNPSEPSNGSEEPQSNPRRVRPSGG